MAPGTTARSRRVAAHARERMSTKVLPFDAKQNVEPIRELLPTLLPSDRWRIPVASPDLDPPSGIVPLWFVLSSNREAVNWRSWDLLAP